jgi:hypothetical protein
MDRNGKKQKATRVDDAAHLERSDTKTQTRDTLDRMNADARLQRERSGGSGAGAARKGKGSGHRG